MPITTEDTLRWLKQLAQVLHENRDYLTQLDSPIGDADHGINMDRGFKAVTEKLSGQPWSQLLVALVVHCTVPLSCARAWRPPGNSNYTKPILPVCWKPRWKASRLAARP